MPSLASIYNLFFLHEINSKLMLIYYPYNYQIFSYVSKNNFVSKLFPIKW